VNLGDIKAAARLRLQDTRSIVWSDVGLALFANDALDELTQSEATLKRVSFSLIEDQRTYSLPTNLLELRGVKINGNKMFGTHASLLEELDSRYLSTTGTPGYYYLQDLLTMAFYPTPSWTDSYTEFEAESGMVSGEDGVVVQVTVDDTDATFDSDSGVLIDWFDTSQATNSVIESLDGEVTGYSDGPFVCQISYVYRVPDLVNDGDTPELPVYMHDALVFYTVAEALRKEGQGQDKKAAKFWQSRFQELQKEWFARNLEWSRGEDQFASQRPVSWGDDLETRMRVWP